jgi:hypothetical protein
MGWALFGFAIVAFALVVSLTEAFVTRGRGRILSAAVLMYFLCCCVGLSVGFDSVGRGIFLSVVSLPIAAGYALMSLRTQ